MFVRWLLLGSGRDDIHHRPTTQHPLIIVGIKGTLIRYLRIRAYQLVAEDCRETIAEKLWRPFQNGTGLFARVDTWMAHSST